MKHLFLLFLLISSWCPGQVLQRQSISSLEGANSINGVSIHQTVGQPYATKTKVGAGYNYRPGFQQPVFSLELLGGNIRLVILPNPALETFFIECEESLEKVKVTATDMAGRLVFSTEADVFKKIEVNCAFWANGVYHVKVLDKSGRFAAVKLIKHQ